MWHCRALDTAALDERTPSCERGHVSVTSSQHKTESPDRIVLLESATPLKAMGERSIGRAGSPRQPTSMEAELPSKPASVLRPNSQPRRSIRVMAGLIITDSLDV